MSKQDGRYALADLSRLADATPRTVRYYVAQGLLPPPLGTGPGRHYAQAHLDRLLLIRRLQREHLPLAEIRERLATLDDSAVADLVREPVAPPADSALDYVRSVLGAGSRATTAYPPPGASPLQPAPPVASAARSIELPRLLRHVPAMPAAPTASAGPTERAARTDAPSDRAEDEQRSQWDRIALTPNVELHVRRPLSRHENKRVDRLITIARQVLREEQP